MHLSTTTEQKHLPLNNRPSSKRKEKWADIISSGAEGAPRRWIRLASGDTAVAGWRKRAKLLITNAYKWMHIENDRFDSTTEVPVYSQEDYSPELKCAYSFEPSVKHRLDASELSQRPLSSHITSLTGITTPGVTTKRPSTSRCCIGCTLGPIVCKTATDYLWQDIMSRCDLIRPRSYLIS